MQNSRRRRRRFGSTSTEFTTVTNTLPSS